MSNTNETYYANVFKGWQVKLLGAKPNETLLATAHAYGKPGKQSLALAMAMRPEGVTAGQVVIACGAPQNNHRRHLIEKGYLKREPAPVTAEGHTVYKVTLTKRGEAKLASVAAAVAKADAQGEVAAPKAKATKAPAKAKGTRKAKPVGEQPPVDTPASEAPKAAEVAPVTEPAAADVQA